MRTIPKISRPLLRPKTFVGSISAHDIASGLLASSEKGAEDDSAPHRSAFRPSFFLSSAYHWRIPFWPSSSFVGPLFSQSSHRSTAAAGNCGEPFRLRFSRQHLFLKFQDHQILHCRANTATRASSSPDIRDSELHLHRSSTFTRASSSLELHDQRSTLHLSSTSVFRDFFIRCISISIHLHRQGNLIFPGHYHRPRRRRHHRLRQSDDFFHGFLQPCTHGPAASNRFQRRGALFLATTTDSGVIAPSAPTSCDIFRRLLPPSRR